MILYFNKNGQLLERLEYGAVPRVGDTTFSIFAYFDGIDLEKYGSAMIRFKRPDLEGSEYPNLFMENFSLNYSSSIEESQYFSSTDNPYAGYIFNFNSITDSDQAIVKLLDTPGMWEASITLINNGGGSDVTGLVRFRVGGAVSEADEEGQELDISEVMKTFGKAISGRVGKGDSLYLRFHSDLITAATDGTLLKSSFIKNSYVYDATTKGIYKIVDVEDNEEDTEGLTVSAEVELIIDLSNLDDIATQTWVNNNFLSKNGGKLNNDKSLTFETVITDPTETTSTTEVKPGEIDIDYDTGSYHQQLIIDHQSIQITDFIESEYLNFTFPAVSGTFATQEWVTGQEYLVASDLTGYATEIWVENQHYLTTAILDGYATEQWVENKGYITGVSWDDVTDKPTDLVHSSDISDMATESYVGTAISNALSNVYEYKGSKTVSEINLLQTKDVGDVYNVSDSGTLTDGNVSVSAGDNVAWDGSVWDKLASTVSLSGYATESWVNNNTVTSINGANGAVSLGDSVGLKVLTTAPSTDNTDGGYKLVILSSVPSTRKSGYIYIITE